MKLRQFVILSAFIWGSLFSCTSETKDREYKGPTTDQKFETYKLKWVGKLWKLNPDWASSQGFHIYDSVLIISTPEWRERVKATHQNMRAEMAAFQAKDLSVHNRIDLRMMENYLDYAAWQDSVFRSYEWDPSVYNIGGPVAEILNGRYDSLPVRLQAISHKIANAPTYYENAISSLKNPTPEHT